MKKNTIIAFNIIVIIIVLGLVFSLLYFYYPPFKNIFIKRPVAEQAKPAEPAKLNLEQQALVDRTLPATIKSISKDKIVVIAGDGETKDIKFTDQTIYRKSPIGGGVLEKALLSDFKKGDAVVITLTGNKTDQELIAEKIDLISPPEIK